VGHETFLIFVAVASWLVVGGLFNRIKARVEALERRLEEHADYLDRLTNYTKESDPRFDEERRLLAELQESGEQGTVSIAVMRHRGLVHKKRARGERTLNDPI
jgi:hypothetical protein